MSERYGAEPYEALVALENWIDDEVANTRGRLLATGSADTARYYAGKLDTLRSVLGFIVVNP